MPRLRHLRLTRSVGRLMIVVGVIVCLASVGVALAATSITTPATSTFTVSGDASGNPLPFTIVATGFVSGQQVFAEQCDGVPATNKFWDPNPRL